MMHREGATIVPGCSEYVPGFTDNHQGESNGGGAVHPPPPPLVNFFSLKICLVPPLSDAGD